MATAPFGLPSCMGHAIFASYVPIPLIPCSSRVSPTEAPAAPTPASFGSSVGVSQAQTGRHLHDILICALPHAPVLIFALLLQETRLLADPLPHELQIAVRATGICGSDVSYYSKFRNGDLCAVAPLSLGHESAGVVVAVGDQVPADAFRIGDRVALEVGVPCDACRSCQRGRYNLCPKMRFRSSAKSVPHFQGTLQERINHPAKWCHK